MTKTQREEYELLKKLLVAYTQQMQSIQTVISELTRQIESEDTTFEEAISLAENVKSLDKKFNECYIGFKKLEPKALELHNLIIDNKGEI